HPPPSEPPLLPLPDALPIWDGRGGARAGQVIQEIRGGREEQPAGDGGGEVQQPVGGAGRGAEEHVRQHLLGDRRRGGEHVPRQPDRKSTRLNSSHSPNSYAV